MTGGKGLRYDWWQGFMMSALARVDDMTSDQGFRPDPLALPITLYYDAPSYYLLLLPSPVVLVPVLAPLLPDIVPPFPIMRC
jgi:hypothetical protein